MAVLSAVCSRQKLLVVTGALWLVISCAPERTPPTRFTPTGDPAVIGDATNAADDHAEDGGQGDNGNGDANIGDANSGDPNSGDPHSGDPNSGDPDSGDPMVSPTHPNDPHYASVWCAGWESGQNQAGYPPNGPNPDPNATFYHGIDGLTGSALEDALRNKIDDHFVATYDFARHYMLTTLDCNDGWVEGVYTGMRVFTDCYFPDNNVINTEHTWPKSRMVGSDTVDGSQSDLHHLFPSQQRANSVRESYIFGNPLWQLLEIPADMNHPEIISGARRGLNDDSELLFESRVEHKGNAARAIFYYAVRYERAISPLEEQALRCWNALDPPDSYERQRNDAITSNLQGTHNRNPFVDHPEYVELIDNF